MYIKDGAKETREGAGDLGVPNKRETYVAIMAKVLCRPLVGPGGEIILEDRSVDGETILRAYSQEPWYARY